MPLMRPLMAALLVAMPAAVAAQQSTADQLRRAKDMYAAFNIEAARPILLNIISPNYLLSVTPAQKVEALKYLGASYAILDKPDSAATFFTAALDFDPFTALDPREFSSAEQSAFARAKLNIFKIAIRPVAPTVLDTSFAFRLITTHRANLMVSLIDTRDTTRREILYQADNDGLRDIPWQGLLRSGARADSAVYELRAEGRSIIGVAAGGTTIDRQLFRIEHVFAPLEDTLRSFASNELLIEEYQPAAPWFDLIKGSALALAAIGIPMLALDNDVPWRSHAAVAAGVGAAAGGIAFQFRRQNRKIPANVAENERRRAQRNEFNAQVRGRNAERIAATIMLICPATGCPR